MTLLPVVGGIGNVFVDADACDAGVETKLTTAGGVVEVTVIGTVTNRLESCADVAVRTIEFATDGAV